jgi:hypothetical protein
MVDLYWYDIWDAHPYYVKFSKFSILTKEDAENYHLSFRIIEYCYYRYGYGVYSPYYGV